MKAGFEKIELKMINFICVSWIKVRGQYMLLIKGEGVYTNNLTKCDIRLPDGHKKRMFLVNFHRPMSLCECVS